MISPSTIAVSADNGGMNKGIIIVRVPRQRL